MRTPRSSQAWRLLQLAALAAAPAVLAACATPYAYVQPAGSGGYYTGSGPYTGQGYYDYYGTGPYYPGTSGWGYYNGTSPYGGWDPYGYGSGWPYRDPYVYYGGYGYGSSIGFDLRFSNVWGFPGYWGPWYTTTWPAYYHGCGYRDCGNHDDDSHGDNGGDDVDPEPRPWLKPDRPRIPPHRTSAPRPPVQVTSRPGAARTPGGMANHRPPTDAPNYMRAPAHRPASPRMGATDVANTSTVPRPTRGPPPPRIVEPPPRSVRAAPVQMAPSPPVRVTPPPTVIRDVQPAPPVRPVQRQREHTETKVH